jgi:hypothetical protein
VRAHELAGELSIVEHRVKKNQTQKPHHSQYGPIVQVMLDGKTYDVTKVEHLVYIDSDGTSNVARLEVTERK